MKKRSIAMMIVLSFVTCGIYNLYWIYASRNEFKQLSQDQSINPAVELLLCLLCFPYFFYWLYKFSADLAKYQSEKGQYCQDNSIINLLLAIFGLGLISELIIQNQLNSSIQE